MIVFDDTTDFARFFAESPNLQGRVLWAALPDRHGSPGGVSRPPCRGKPLGGVTEERQRLDDLALVMTDASICGLGQTAASRPIGLRLSLPGAAI